MVKTEQEAGGRMRMHEKVAYLVFAINAFQVRCNLLRDLFYYWLRE